MNKVYSLLLLLLFVAACGTEEGTIIQVDMSQERDEGRFNPENGDFVSIAGVFNSWEIGIDKLNDPEGDWIYEIRKQDLPDTLEFKFVVSSSTNLDLPNSGWEIIPNRILAKATIENDDPVLTFNVPWSPTEVIDILFSVSMSNQEVLNFFNPEVDQVVVSGSFTGWDSQGIELEDNDRDGVYELEVPIDINPVKPHLYKFKINKASGFDGYIPNDGWENEDRILLSASDEVEYFNNQQRVARFLISEEWLKEEALNGIERADMFQIKFYVGEETYLSEPMIKNKNSFYETSISIPLMVDKVKWVVVENQSNELGEGIREDIITHKGELLTLQ